PAVFGRRYWSCSRNGTGCRAVRRNGWDPLPPAFGRLATPYPRSSAFGRRYLPPSLRSGGLILALASLRGTHPGSRFAPGDSSWPSLRSGGLITGPSRFSLDTGRGFRDTCLVDNWGFREAVGIT